MQDSKLNQICKVRSFTVWIVADCVDGSQISIAWQFFGLLVEPADRIDLLRSRKEIVEHYLPAVVARFGPYGAADATATEEHPLTSRACELITRRRDSVGFGTRHRIAYGSEGMASFGRRADTDGHGVLKFFLSHCNSAQFTFPPILSTNTASSDGKHL